MDTEYQSTEGELIVVPAGGDFQAALDRARPGDTIELEARSYFQGPFTLPRKRGDDWIVIRSSGAGLPDPGNRVSPANAGAMAKLVADNGSVISTAVGAHHYRFVGVEISPTPTNNGNETSLVNVVLLGDQPRSMDDMPHHIIFDRCYIHGDAAVGSRRGIAMNSAYTAVVDSYFSDFKLVDRDTQAIAGWGGSGPYRISNNYLEASGENILFGGADPAIRGLVPSDIEVIGNHFAKPLAWRIGDPAYSGIPFSVKNLFELKNARRVLVDGNVFEYNWPHSQNGFAILFTVRNQDGSAPWSLIEDVSFTNNVLRHIGSGINILGHDDAYPSGQTRRILIENNLFENVGGEWGNGRLFQMLDGADDVAIVNNTAFNTENVIMAEGRSHYRFVFDSNIVVHNDFGIIGVDYTMGSTSLNRYFPSAAVTNNVMIGGRGRFYPDGNHFPSSIRDIGFTDVQAGDFRLGLESPYLQSDPKSRPGADIDSLCSALSRSDWPEYCY